MKLGKTKATDPISHRLSPGKNIEAVELFWDKVMEKFKSKREAFRYFDLSCVSDFDLTLEWLHHLQLV